MGLDDLLRGFHKEFKSKYNEILGVVKKLKYKLSAIQEFINDEGIEEFVEIDCCSDVNKVCSKRIGYYISALINNKIGEDDVLELEIPYKISYLGGYHSKGKLVVNGDARNYLGEKMSGGKIHVLGKAYYRIGEEMSGGEIIIDGNVRNIMGWKMSGGRITINGNAGNHVGEGMIDGEIHVSGNAGDNLGGFMTGGLIIINGKVNTLGVNTGGIIISENNIKGLNEKGIKDLIKKDIKLDDYATITDNILYALLKHPRVLEHKDQLFSKETLDKYEHVFIEAALEAA